VQTRIAAIAFLVALVSACAEKSTPFGDQTGIPNPTRPAELQGTLHGALGADWSDFDRALATVAPWTGGHIQKRCTDAFACGLLLSKEDVQIQANPQSTFADYTSVGNYGTILFKLENTGGRPTADLHLGPAPAVYYIIVRTGGSKNWEWALVKTAPSEVNSVVGDWRPFLDCAPHHKPNRATANFQTCHKPEPTSLRQASLLNLAGFWHVTASAFNLLFAIDPPAWISCAYGCCTVA
jgi:hypothetical protein